MILKNDNNTCLICFAYYDENDLIPVNINEKVLKNCSCSYLIHKSCLNDWYEINNKCLICHNKIYKKQCINYVKYYIYNNKCIITLTYLVDKFPKLNIFLCILFIIVIVFLKITNLVEKNNYEYNKYNNISFNNDFSKKYNKYLNI